MNKTNHCKLKKIQQRRLLEFFVLEATARSAADMLEIHPNTAALFYKKKIRQVISAHLEHDAQELFDGAVELDESYFGGRRKGKRGRGAAGKVAVLASSSAKARSTRRSSATLEPRRCDAHYFPKNQA